MFVMHKKADKWPVAVKVGSVTVKIYRTVNRGRPMFTASYHEAGGRKLRQFAELPDARREAKIIAERLNAGQGAALELTGKDRDAFLYAIRKLKPLGIALPSAIDEFIDAKAIGVPLLASAQFYKAKHHAKLPERTVSEVMEEFIKAKTQDGMSLRYLSDCRSRMGRLAEDIKMPIAELETSNLDAWLRGLDVKGRSRNNYRAMLMTLFRFARSKGYLPKGEATAAEELQRAKQKSGETGIFTPQQFLTLLNADPKEMEDATTKEKLHGDRKFLVPYFVMGGFCGLRHAEITRLEWSDLDFAQKVVRVGADKAKTASNRIVPLSDEAIAWLTPYIEKTGNVCSDRQSKYARQVAVKLGTGWPANALRHSYGTYRLATVKSAAQVALEMGNSPKMVFAHYRKPVTEQDAKLYFSIMPKSAVNVIQMKGAA
jgi:integrase